MIAELREISRNYSPGLSQPVLEGINLQIDAGSRIAVTGPSGSGKTTLLNILGTLDRPDSGKVFLNSEDTAAMDGKRLAWFRNRFVGFVFQSHYLLPQLNVMENVLLPTIPLRQAGNSSEVNAFELLKHVGLGRHLEKFPSTLSPGECQRVAVVRSLINNPSLLLADEPTGSLDSTNAALLTDLLLNLNRELGFAMVVVTHSAMVSGRMDEVYRLEAGKISRHSQMSA